MWSENQVADYLKRLGHSFSDELELYRIAFNYGFVWNEEDENYVVPKHLLK